MYADVIINITHEALDRPFEYRIPDKMSDSVREGTRVLVPFGPSNKEKSAVVIGIHEKAIFNQEKIKDIISVNEKGIDVDKNIMELALWMKEKYGCTLASAIATVVPVKAKVKGKTYKNIKKTASDNVINDLLDKTNPVTYAGRYRLLSELKHADELPLDIIVNKLGVSEAVVKTLEKNKIVEIESIRSYRVPRVSANSKYDKKILSEEQKNAVNNIIERLGSEFPGVTLLHGITGSGKTEVYLEVIEETLKRGCQAIVLIPEIALTYQTLIRFYTRFGDKVSILNSSMSDGERYDQYERAKNGEISVIIGPRSALFVPFPKIGVIIIDEEHEGSYKSDRMPRYSAVQVAEHIATNCGALLLLGSATPSLGTYYRAKKKEISLEEITKRNSGSKLPSTYIVDMRDEIKKGNKSAFSDILKEKLTECILEGHQAMLFINRRGYAGFVSCRSCGYVYKCPHCDVALNEHGKKNVKMVCHYCGYETPMINRCPECGSPYFLGMRAGTQQIQDKLQELFPNIKILRMDSDTTRNKDDYEKILTSFSQKEADVLVGTQMIVKGHDFSNVTLVGIIAADMSLYSADYMSAEKTFQLITQAAGRAGRGAYEGNVIIQTYKPDNYAIIHAANQNYQGFYEEEIVYRTIAGYPPVSHMLRIMIYGIGEEEAADCAEMIFSKIRNQYGEKGLTVLKPGKAAISKIKDIYRNAIYVKNADKMLLEEVMRFTISLEDETDKRRITIQYDMDPVNAF